jgi:hypothetical protein
MSSICDDIRLAEGENQTFSKLYVDEDKDLIFLDSDNNETVLTDGYARSIKSVFIDGTSGAFDYDTTTAPSFKLINTYWQCAALSGSYSSGVYQEFKTKPFLIPQDYHSGGRFKVYGFLDSCSGDVYIQEVTVVGIRVGDNTQSVTWWDSADGTLTITMTQEVLTTMCEFEVYKNFGGSAPIQAGDMVMVRIQRRAGHASDTASSGDLAIMGVEFFYNANIPKKTY